MRTYPRIAAVLSVVAVAALAVPAAAAAQSEATSPTSPVNLATPVDLGAAKAAPGATVVAGDARFEVLGNGLIRMEYSPTASFEDAPTVNALNRRFQVPRYRARQSHGAQDHELEEQHARQPQQDREPAEEHRPVPPS